MLKIPTKTLWGARKLVTYPKSGLGRLTATRGTEGHMTASITVCDHGLGWT